MTASIACVVCSHAQVADAANTAAFEVALANIKPWAEDNGFIDISSITMSQQDDFVKQLLQQWLLHRYGI